MTYSQNAPVTPSLDLNDMMSIYVDDDGIWHRPEYPRYTQDLAAPKPFLVPSFDDEVVEVLPSEKQNRKICFDESVYVLEIENRFQLMEPEEMDDDESYEIEIVESTATGGCDDADFYLEMIDGEIFYVFETEDDISVDECEDESDGFDEASSDSETQTTQDSRPIVPMQLNIGEMLIPNLDPEESCKHLDAGDLIDADSDNDLSGELSQSGNNMIVCETSDAMISNTSDNNRQFEQTNMSPTRDDSFSQQISFEKLTVDNELYASFAVGDDTFENAAMSPPESPPREGTTPLSSFLSPAISPMLSPDTSSHPRSILKACMPSPTKPNKKRDKKLKKDKKEKTFSKTFVRAADFDGEHRVFSWEKPTWTNQKLKSTGKGDDIRKGANLANPITDAAVLIEKGAVKWEKPEWAVANGDNEDGESDDINAKEELIRKIQDGSMNLRGMRTSSRRLKLSINGSLLAAGNDIVKPITKATIIKKPSNINYIANPKILRATPGGSKLWKGENLAGPVTQATSIKKYDWEKPSWVKPNLHSTGVGEILKTGVDVTKPLSSKANVEWEKPDWTKKRTIGRNNSSAASASEAKKEYTWETPSWAKTRIEEEKIDEGSCVLKATEKGQLARRGRDLARPITNLPNMVRASECSSDNESPRRGSRQIRRSLSDDL
jgi:hypothetical protein